MIGPLSLKSQQNSMDERKGNVISAAELLAKFSMKSPTNERAVFNEQSSNKSRPIIPKPRQLGSRKNSSKNDEISFKGQKDAKSVSSAGVSVFKKKSKQIEKENASSQKQLHKVKESSKFNENKSLVLQQLFENKENICTNTKIIQPLSTQRSHTLKANINLTDKAPIPLTTKHSKDQSYFRKMSIASTLSFKTKHTASLQQFQDDSDMLFVREPLVESIYKKVDENVFQALDNAKKKIYHLIYSLDKKLMNDFPVVSKKPKIINLRKKREKTEENKPQ